MNIISLAVSTFITNYFIMFIIRILPLRKKRVWQIAVISLFCVGEILGYLLTFVEFKELTLIDILEIVGSIFGVGIGYVASMMIILDGVSLFKSRRLREFERNLNNKEGTSIPRWVLAVISLSLGIVLLIYGAVTASHYDARLLLTIIGVFVGAFIFLVVSILLFISGAPKHKTIKAQNLLFIVELENEKLLYQAELTKEFGEANALGKINDYYMPDEFGLLITPKRQYIVKGIRLEYTQKHMLQELHMELLGTNLLDEAISHFQKYNRKKIVLNENNAIEKITLIK